jgi:hypothetical protein
VALCNQFSEFGLICPMANFLELARPMMRHCTGFNANDARWQILEGPMMLPSRS